jgi:hypothetical protein
VQLSREAALSEEMAGLEQNDQASLPACDKTDSLTAPSSIYMTLVAGSP